MCDDAERNAYNECIKLGCCCRCSLRYAGNTMDNVFSNPELSLELYGFVQEDFLPQAGPSSQPEVQTRLCVVCLGLLDNSMIETMACDENLLQAEEYTMENFKLQLTIPNTVLLRDRSMRIYLKQRFPDTFDPQRVVKVAVAWRLSMQEEITLRINKRMYHGSRLNIHYMTSYSRDEDECYPIENFVAKKKRRTSFVSRHFLSELLLQIPDEELVGHIPIPPTAPSESLRYERLEMESDILHLIGNYVKRSTFLLQVPLQVNKRTVINYSIQNIIFHAIEHVLGRQKKMYFQASSFDDRNVRVLGKGRTFHIEIRDPKFPTISTEDLEKIQNRVRESLVIEVKELREDEKKNILFTLQSEAICPKTYKLICIVHQHTRSIDQCVNRLNMYPTLEIAQKTPVKVLNIRTVTNKIKKILYLKAKIVPGWDNLIEINLKAEGGLHLNEFINGDLGRTKPSLGDLINAKVEAIAIDIVDFVSDLACAAILD